MLSVATITVATCSFFPYFLVPCTRQSWLCSCWQDLTTCCWQLYSCAAIGEISTDTARRAVRMQSQKLLLCLGLCSLSTCVCVLSAICTELPRLILSQSWTNEWIFCQRRHNTVKTVKSRTVSTGQKSSKSTYNCPERQVNEETHLYTLSMSCSNSKKVKVAHTRLPSVSFRSWSRLLAVSLQVTWIINPTVGCHYFPPGLQLPP